MCAQAVLPDVLRAAPAPVPDSTAPARPAQHHGQQHSQQYRQQHGEQHSGLYGFDDDDDDDEHAAAASHNDLSDQLQVYAHLTDSDLLCDASP